MSPLRIAVPIEQFWHRVPGGTARATKETITALAAIEGISLAPIAAWHRPSERRRAADLGPVAYVRAPRPVLYESWIRRNRPLVERSVGPIDVAWASSMVPPASRSPLVATVHDVDFLDNPDRLSGRGRSFFPRAWEAVGERARLIVCPSRSVVDDCRRHGIDGDRLRVVPWGVRRPICSDVDAARVTEGLGLPERFVLWVGTLEPRKNLPRLVDAMNLLGETPLVVVGPPGWNVDGADVLGPLGERAHQVGVVDEVQLSGLYRAAAAFAYPSLAEGFGLPVLEAMAHGTPVVTSAGTATEEVAGGAAILVDPSRPEDIAAGLSAALEAGAANAERVEMGLKRAAELSWASTAEGYAAVFREAVRDAARDPAGPA